MDTVKFSGLFPKLPLVSQNSMTFPHLEVAIANSMTFQIFHALGTPTELIGLTHLLAAAAIETTSSDPRGK